MTRLRVVGEEPDLFSYAALSREDEVAAKADAEVIKAHMRSAAESIIEVGLALKRQKERLPHGMFLPWIRAEFQWDARTAQRFMLIADQFGANTALVPHLGFKALAELAAPSTPQDVRDHVEELLVDGQKITAADVRRLKQEALQRAAPAIATKGKCVVAGRGKLAHRDVPKTCRDRLQALPSSWGQS